MNNQITSLIQHGAMIRNLDDGSCIPLTTRFYRKAVDACRKSNCNAVTFSLVHPGINEELHLTIHKDGHVDCGSPESIRACLDR